MVNFPNNENRTTVIGKTGSGKTVFGIWLLSTCCTLNWKSDPVIIFDFKGDKLIAKIEAVGGCKEISIFKAPPTKPGLYVVRPMPHDMEAVEAFLWKAWANENTGLFFDEGYMLAKSRAFNAILTQGRSKNLPCIILLQRPSWAPRFCFTEAQYFALLRLTDDQDLKRVSEFMNTDVKTRRLPYNALWYDDGANAGEGLGVVFKPVPREDEIIKAFARPNSRAQMRMI